MPCLQTRVLAIFVKTGKWTLSQCSDLINALPPTVGSWACLASQAPYEGHYQGKIGVHRTRALVQVSTLRADGARSGEHIHIRRHKSCVRTYKRRVFSRKNVFTNNSTRKQLSVSVVRS